LAGLLLVRRTRWHHSPPAHQTDGTRFCLGDRLRRASTRWQPGSRGRNRFAYCSSLAISRWDTSRCWPQSRCC